MSLSISSHSRVPPGFRFHPTEGELLHYYLRKKVASEKIDLDVILEIDLNKLEPWDIEGDASINDKTILPRFVEKFALFQSFFSVLIMSTNYAEKCKVGSTPQNEWYFFSHKDKKYPTGTRTNRATAAGFWKATGRDKVIYSSSKRIGMRKTLVFYMGRAPRGQKSDWIMHEYRLEEENTDNNSQSNVRTYNIYIFLFANNIYSELIDETSLI